MNIIGAYVCWGEDVKPFVFLLGMSSDKHFQESLRICDSDRMRHSVYARTFGTIGVQYALPAWNHGAMETIAIHYKGVHETVLRGLCAAIATGTPYGPNDDGPDGGQPVELKPVPKPPRGGNGNAFMALMGRSQS